MLSPDKGTRNLLPNLLEEPSEMMLTAPAHEGQVSQVQGPPVPAAQVYTTITDQASIHQTGLSQQDLATTSQSNPTAAAQNPNASPSLFDVSSSAGVDRGTAPTSAEADDGISAIGSGGSTGGMGAGSLSAFPAASSEDSSAPAADPATGSSPETTTETIFTPTPGGAVLQETPLPAGLPAPGSIPLLVPDGDSINVVQVALVDQDTEVLLNGWVGESKVRVFVDNDTDMAQDADIDLDLDGTGQLRLRLNQSMTINQDTEIDVDIYEVKGVLYVDLYVKNEIDIEQDTELDLMMGGWSGPSWVSADNDLDVRQVTDVDVDIADDLEEKFSIKVAVNLKQTIDADQDIDIDLNYAQGAFGFDVDAVQTAMIDQETTVKIDFAVV